MTSRKMKFWRLVVPAALLVGCSDYLTGPGLTISPNDPTEGTIDQFFAAIVASQVTQQEGLLARLSGMFVQHFSGTGRQHKVMGAYSVTEGDIDEYFTRIYTGGGLVDLRKVQALAKELGDSTYAGITMFWEALSVGTAASLWGDIPYSEAVTDGISKPTLDPQEAVYHGVISKLDTAILWIAKTAGLNRGPQTSDLVYAGDRTKYVQAANTLKARLAMHWVEAQLVGGASATAATTACGGDCLTLARDAALLGIASNANNLNTYHGAPSAEWNIWHQFIVVERNGDIGAGKALVDTVKARRGAGDQRVAAYFDSVSVGAGAFDFRGADQNGIGTPFSTLSATRINPSFRQPLLTAAENSLILAEAQFRLGAAGPALTALNAARAFSAGQLAVAVPALGALSGTALLTAIKAEKWITMFQNIDAWSDYKRNCYPALTPATGATAIPGRLLYGENERQTNSNIPAVSQQPARNENDPKACNDPTHPA